MDHFVVFPVNEDGIFLNPQLVSKALDDAMSPPFNFSDIFIYSHGWWTTGNDAMASIRLNLQKTCCLMEIILRILLNTLSEWEFIGLRHKVKTMYLFHKRSNRCLITKWGAELIKLELMDYMPRFAERYESDKKREKVIRLG